MRIYLYVCAILLCICTVGYAQEPVTEYVITAKQMTYAQEKSHILLRGSVTIVNTDFIVKSDEVDVLLKKTKKTALSFGSDSIQEILFRKNVHFTYKKQENSAPIVGTSDRAKYVVAKEIMYLYGNVIVQSEENVIEGDEVEINLITNNIQVHGNAKKPVEVILKPRSGE